jgi:hypothetical protein
MEREAARQSRRLTVYVDDMRANVGRMVMCHMVGTDEGELHAMAARIGVARRWYQGDHYDVCLASRSAAVRAGAVEVDMRTLGIMTLMRKRSGRLPTPDEAVNEHLRRMRDRRRCMRCTCRTETCYVEDCGRDV